MIKGLMIALESQKKSKKQRGENMTTNIIERPSQLTDEERAETKKLTETFALIPDDVGKRIALAFLEGMAAASNPKPPKATA